MDSWSTTRSVALERLALTAGDERAAGDIAALGRRDGAVTALEAVASQRRRWRSGSPWTAMSRGAFVDAVERSLVQPAGDRDILPGACPPTWLGANFEVHGLPTSARSTLSFAVRWHGDRPALLWEQSGPPVTLTATAIDPAWRSDAPSGEALLAAPAERWRPADDPVSFT